MDIEAKKVQVQEDIARQPANVVFARIDIVNEIQLADLMKAAFIPYFRGTAKSVSSGTTGNTTDTLHAVCVNLAKQRALLQGAAASDVIFFNIHSTTNNSNVLPYTTNGDLTFPTLEDASYSNKTSLPFTVLHDLNSDGGIVTLSSTSNANTSITNDDGEAVKFFTDFSKYFLTRSRANGELITIDENNAPYTTPTVAEPFVPANTINGETFVGTASDPTANSDVRHEFSLTANTTAVGFAGANNDITENKFQGNTFVTLALSNATGTFSVDQTITDFDGNTATIKIASNTTSVLLESGDVKGTFQSGEILTDGSTNASISTIETANTSASLTLTGNTFLTGSNTSLELGFTVANTITLNENTVIRTGSKVVVTANNHGVSPGEYIVLKGATDDFSEFNDTFIVQDVTQNTLSFTTTNAISATPTGDFSIVKNVVFGRTSNASAAITSRTVNASANVVFQSDDLSAGFPIGNTITSPTASGVIDSRTIGGAWYQVKTNEVKTYYAASDSGTWDYDVTNNPQGIESTANTGEFWLKNNEMVRINQLVAETNAGTSTETAPKMVLDITLATSSDKSGGYDSTIDTQVPGAYFAYPLKTYEDQVHDGVTTLEAFDNFANVVIAPEGLEVNFDWKPLANSSGVATNSTHINADGSVTNSSFNPEEVTTLNKTNFEAHLANYTTSTTNDVFLSSDPDVKSSGAKDGTNQFLSVNANPFFPAVNGTHKRAKVTTGSSGTGTTVFEANTANDLTGTQPGGLTANDIYAGGYTEVQTGATEPAGDFRYRIWNDIKWTYGTNPHATGASKSGAYNVPRESGTTATKGDFLDAYDGYTNTLDAQLDSVTNDTPSGTTNADRTAGNFQLAAGASSITAASGTNTPVDTTLKLVNATSGLYGSIVVTSTHSGTGGGTVSYSTGSFTEIDCFNNFCIKILTDGAIVPSGTFSLSSSEYQTNVIILNTLLTNLTASSTSNTAYVDPVSHALGGSRIITDAAFETSIGNLKTELSDFVSVFNSEIIAIKAAGATVTGSGTAPSIPNCITSTYSPAGFGGSGTSHTSNLYTAYSNYKTQLATTRTDITNRITEISNRIGYVNSKDVAIGGSGTKSVSGTNQGFQGYSFNNGNGYANTIYSHANFLAGKKIKLFEKIITAINDVQALYDQVKSKRSEYFEFNQ